MDAHTLNAWTRFALQKGGIGACTALIDNPASEQEDLMFMQGEQITVLRKLDDEAGAGTSRKSEADGGWYLGYCEGVVGRFRGAHVRFHGKLKKPVLMRRSGVGAIRESTTKPMSQAQAASLHMSQVPAGIPIMAVDSDDEGTSGDSGAKRSTQQLTVDSLGVLGKAVAASSRDTLADSRDSSATRPKLATQGQASAISRANLGVTTPPLSDESHARQGGQADPNDSDSDESETLLPWARRSQSPDKPAVVQSRLPNGGLQKTREGPGRLPNGAAMPPSPISSSESPTAAKRGSPSIPTVVTPGHLSSTSSLLSSAATSESGEDEHSKRDHTLSIYDLYGRDSVAFPNFAWRDSGGSSPRISESRSSDSLRPNDTNQRPTSPRHSPLRPRDTDSDSATPEPTTPVDRRPAEGEALGLATALRSPSAKRPNAAPPVIAPGALGGVGAASILRRKLEAPAATTPTAPSSGNMIALPASDSGGSLAGAPPPSHRPNEMAPNGAMPPPAPISFDPKRRPSAKRPMLTNTPGIAPPGIGEAAAAAYPPPPPSEAGSVGTSARQSNPVEIAPGFFAPATPSLPPPGESIVPEAMAGGSPRSMSMRRPGFAEARSASRNGSVGRMQLELGASGRSPGPGSEIASTTVSTATSPVSSEPPSRSPFSAASTLPPVMRNSQNPSPGVGPTRASSDRTSMRERERVGSGQLRKNPSNPSPGLHGGMQGLTVGPPSAGPLSAHGSRSPSPLSGIGSPSTTPSPRPPSARSLAMEKTLSAASAPNRAPNAAPYGGPRPSLPVDALGFFVTGTGAPLLPPPEDPEAVEKWSAIIAENDVAGAKKSRKVRKLVHAGIPSSIRAKVWLFLANSSHRRRPGLFEQLCKQSQAAKARKGKEALYEAIEKDLDRCYPDHHLFQGENSTGRADLEAILKAYLHYNPIVGYTQGMGMVAGLMLILMPAEDAFWLLCALLRDIHMEGYYASELKQLHVDGVVFGQLLQAMDAELADRLMALEIQPINFTPNWFLPLFARLLPWQTLLRVWDIFFYEGPSWILRVALSVIRILRPPLMDTRLVPGHAEGMRLLLHPPQSLLTTDNVLSCALSVKLKDGELRKLSRNASKLVRQSIIPRGRTMSASASVVQRSVSAPARRP